MVSAMEMKATIVWIVHKMSPVSTHKRYSLELAFDYFLTHTDLLYASFCSCDFNVIWKLTRVLDDSDTVQYAGDDFNGEIEESDV